MLPVDFASQDGLSPPPINPVRTGRFRGGAACRYVLCSTLFLLGTGAAKDCGVFGLTVNSPTVLQAVEAKVGCQFRAVRWFQDWNTPFNSKYAQELEKQGRVVELSWQPRYLNSQGKLVGVPYWEIGSGRHDVYLRRFARDIRASGGTVTITFAPEMNGDWGAYQLGPKNTAKDFVWAWRHTVNLFRAERAPVRWVWTPNIMYRGMKSTYQALYPGDSFVDEVGLDGYNWGTTNPYNRWMSFSQTFDASYLALKRITNKPMQLGELSSVEQGGNKGQWITDMCRVLPHYTRIRKAFWFHLLDGKVDWRLTTSQNALMAFRKCFR